VAKVKFTAEAAMDDADTALQDGYPAGNGHPAPTYAELVAQVAHLQAALTSRAVIEQAKGILIASTGRDADGAFQLLVAQSQAENRKVREIAEELVRRNVRTAGAPVQVIAAPR
jgi:hypothetical protein